MRAVERDLGKGGNSGTHTFDVTQCRSCLRWTGVVTTVTPRVSALGVWKAGTAFVELGGFGAPLGQALLVEGPRGPGRLRDQSRVWVASKPRVARHLVLKAIGRTLKIFRESILCWFA